MRYVFWSREFYPKVFGGVFLLVCLCTSSRAGDKTEDAAKASGRALFIYSGLDKKLKEIQEDYRKQALKYFREYNLEKEVIVVGTTVKVVRDRKIEFDYKGNHYLLSPNYIEIRIPFK